MDGYFQIHPSPYTIVDQAELEIWPAPKKKKEDKKEVKKEEEKEAKDAIFPA